MFVLPPGRTPGTWAMTPGLSKPRAAGMGSSTCEPLLNVSRETRSLRPSNESMNVRAASLTGPHLSADRARDVEDERQVHHAARRLTGGAHRHRHDVPQLHERRRQHRGRRDGHGIDAGRGVDGGGVEPGRGGRIARKGPQVLVRKVRLEDPLGGGPRVAAVQRARRRQRRTVDRLGQLRLHHIGPARVDGDSSAEEQHGQRHRHVDERKPVVLPKMR